VKLGVYPYPYQKCTLISPFNTGVDLWNTLGENQNIGGKRAVIADESMGVYQLLGARAAP